MFNLLQIEQKVHNKIPISKEMGISIERFDSSGLLIKAPILNNINHNQTAFGGSLNAVAILSCWIFLYLFLVENEKAHPQIILQKSRIDYLKPVTTDFHAICSWPNNQSLGHFRKVLERKKRARIELSSTIFTNEETEVAFSGSFVVIDSSKEIVC